MQNAIHIGDLNFYKVPNFKKKFLGALEKGPKTMQTSRHVFWPGIQLSGMNFEIYGEPKSKIVYVCLDTKNTARSSGSSQEGAQQWAFSGYPNIFSPGCVLKLGLTCIKVLIHGRDQNFLHIQNATGKKWQSVRKRSLLPIQLKQDNYLWYLDLKSFLRKSLKKHLNYLS